MGHQECQCQEQLPKKVVIDIVSLMEQRQDVVNKSSDAKMNAKAGAHKSGCLTLLVLARTILSYSVLIPASSGTEEDYFSKIKRCKKWSDPCVGFAKVISDKITPWLVLTSSAS
jgi:hypothetical protein